jgi:hypothetical protein
MTAPRAVRALAGLACLVLAGDAFAAAPPAARPAPPPAKTLESSRVLATKLAASGRAMAKLERRERDPFSGAITAQRATLALEPPDRARLDFESGGERVTLRGDGGEWLQPNLGQMLKLSSDQAAAALRWWQLLMPGAEKRFREAPAGPKRWLVLAPDAAGAADSAWVELDRAGLPARLAFRDAAGESVSVAFHDWRFEHARGRAAFVLAAPAGIQVIELP